MAMAGINSEFKPHSTRAASTSKAFQSGIHVADILDKAGWSNARTFATFYNKSKLEEDKFQADVLQH